MLASGEMQWPIDASIVARLDPLVQSACLAAATLTSEDLTCIAAGLFARAQQVTLFVAITGCAIGIFLGDLGLWLIGRYMGRRALRWRWVERRLPAARVEAVGHWFDERGWRAIVASRFMPGTRVPVYVAAGIVGRRPAAFMLWTLLAVAIWTPLLVGLTALLGPAFVSASLAFLGGGWIALLLCLRIGTMAWSEIGRARVAAAVSRLWRWEFWPTWLFYIPLYPWIAWLALRHRGLNLPTAANPAFPHGGVVGESKADILAMLPAECVMPFELLPPGSAATRLESLERIMSDRAWTYPIILKPDSGERGASVRLARDRAAAEAYFERLEGPVIAQAHHAGPYEAGVFYYRMPGEAAGRIFSITDKQFSFIVGDGKRNVEQLIWRHPRYRMQARRFLARLADRADDILAPGERLQLAVAGNHCQGTLFRDGAHLITPELEESIGRIAERIDGFYFGRFDVRYADAEAFRAGRDFRIIELNGVTSESTNIYDPSWSIFRAYATLFRQWSILFSIGAANRARGHRPSAWTALLQDIRSHYRGRRIDPLAD